MDERVPYHTYRGRTKTILKARPRLKKGSANLSTGIHTTVSRSECSLENSLVHVPLLPCKFLHCWASLGFPSASETEPHNFAGLGRPIARSSRATRNLPSSTRKHASLLLPTLPRATPPSVLDVIILRLSRFCDGRCFRVCPASPGAAEGWLEAPHPARCRHEDEQVAASGRRRGPLVVGYVAVFGR